VLIAHEDAFHRSYLEDVLSGSGAEIAGVERTAAAALVRLEGEPLLDALVLSSSLPEQQATALADVARRRKVAILVVEPARGVGRAVLGAEEVLTAPYAGFQVVEAVAGLLAARPDTSAAPQSAGHRA